jgi:hypothetical protein
MEYRALCAAMFARVLSDIPAISGVALAGSSRPGSCLQGSKVCEKSTVGIVIYFIVSISQIRDRRVPALCDITGGGCRNLNQSHNR